jgi:hypothetical protein
MSAGQLQASSKVRQAGFIGDLNGITTKLHRYGSVNHRVRRSDVTY